MELNSFTEAFIKEGHIKVFVFQIQVNSPGSFADNTTQIFAQETVV